MLHWNVYGNIDSSTPFNWQKALHTEQYFLEYFLSLFQSPQLHPVMKLNITKLNVHGFATLQPQPQQTTKMFGLWFTITRCPETPLHHFFHALILLFAKHGKASASMIVNHLTVAYYSDTFHHVQTSPRCFASAKAFLLGENLKCHQLSQKRLHICYYCYY